MFRTASIAVSLWVALAAPAAGAAKDDGPYTPFPEGDPGPRAVHYINRLNAARAPGQNGQDGRVPGSVSTRELIKGAKLADTGTTPASEKAVPRADSPAGRAGVSGRSGPPPGVLPFGFAALLLAVAAIAFERRARRRPSHA